MNINSINNIQVQQSFRGKAPQKFVQIITEQRPVSQYTKDYLLPKINEVANIAKEYGKPVRVAQLANERLLVNVGSLSKIIDATKIKAEELPRVLTGMIKGNSIAQEEGLKKGLSYIA